MKVGDVTWASFYRRILRMLPAAHQRIKATTDTSGVYTWTFPTPYDAGVLPVISTAIEDLSGGSVSFNHKLTAISNTAATVTVTRTMDVTVLGVSLLGVQSAAATTIHLTAIAP